MEYVFGTNNGKEILKTKGDIHSDMTGYQETVREFPRETITDNYRIVRKIDSQEDMGGNCYDWYEIDHHYRVIDASQSALEEIDRNTARIDYVAMMTGVDIP